MALKSLVYSLKVWISTIVLGGIIFLAWLSLTTSGFTVDNLEPKFVGSFFLFSLVASIPALLLFWWGANYFCRTLHFARQRRLWLALMSFALTFLSIFVAVTAMGGPAMAFIGMTALLYYVVLLAGIYLYRLPEPPPDANPENS